MTTMAPGQPCRYQRWSGELNRGRWTWLAIVTSGVRRTLKHAKTRALLMTSMVFVLGACGIFYVLSLVESLAGSPEAEPYYGMLKTLLRVDVSGIARLEEYRELLWRSVFLLFFGAQMLWVLLVVARVGPGLIANDLKARALPIYFAKPVTPLTYLFGKWLIVAAFIAMVTLVPNLLSLLIGTLITGGLDTVGQTLSLGWDLFLSGLGVCVVAGAIILALSSLTSDSRYVAASWLGICLLLHFGQWIVGTVPDISTEGFLGCISLQDNVRALTDWLFGMREAWEATPLPPEVFSAALAKPVKPACAGTVMGAWTAVAILIAYHQIVSFSRKAANV